MSGRKRQRIAEYRSTTSEAKPALPVELLSSRPPTELVRCHPRTLLRSSLPFRAAKHLQRLVLTQRKVATQSLLDRKLQVTLPEKIHSIHLPQRAHQWVTLKVERMQKPVLLIECPYRVPQPLIRIALKQLFLSFWGLVNKVFLRSELMVLVLNSHFALLIYTG